MSEKLDMLTTPLPSVAETAAFVNAGYDVDELGRPLHPAYSELIQDPNMAEKTGKGGFWNWGPNYTADPIVITGDQQPHILLIQRKDTGDWALPGGFVDPEDDTPLETARRELEEEAGLTLTAEATPVYSGVVSDRRATLNAWPETSAYLFTVETAVPVAANDDAQDARWVSVVELDQLSLYGSHKFLIDEALRIQKEQNEYYEKTIITAGHMAYEHAIITTSTDRFFSKEHKPEQFSDPFREQHSRAYLVKEAAVYEHVAKHGFTAIPDNVSLQNDTLLIMKALHEDEGWKWRAPAAPYTQKYTQDVLAALQNLQLVPVATEQPYHEHISPTYETLWREGWDELEITAGKEYEVLINKISRLTEGWATEQKEDVAALIRDITTLHLKSAEQSRTPDLFMAHNDARQSNIAWHPQHGARLADWSWADPAPENADATMFLIDLAKSGYDVTPYTEVFNKDHALTLIGFWLAHSLWQTRDGSSTVREHQVASAVAAHKLLIHTL